jgi:hypothetical protein
MAGCLLTAYLMGDGWEVLGWLFIGPIFFIGGPVGALAGAWLMEKYPKVFWVTVFPAAVYAIWLLFDAGVITLSPYE